MLRSPHIRVSLALLGLALLCLPFGDFAIATVEPWHVLGRLALGILTPDFTGLADLGAALVLTVAFGLTGVALGSGTGFLLALLFHRGAVRRGCAFVRAIHELFWALLLMQVFGPSALTGVLAIALPYAGTFAKVYAEILDEADTRPLAALPAGTGPVAAFLFARLPDAARHLKVYTLYRLECGMRSSAVLGFVGLPTMGFHLESTFKQGYYSQAAALLFLFYGLIATVPWWARPRLLPLWLAGSLLVLPWQSGATWAGVVRFVTVDIVPAPLRVGELGDPATWSALGDWAGRLLVDQALPGALNTLLLGQITLAGAGLAALLGAPLLVTRIVGRRGRLVGHVALVVVRSTPEYMLAFVLLQLWGPSMLPAAVALALHNGAIIGHLIGRYGDSLPLRPDAPHGLDLYAWEIVPRVYGQFLAFLFYRWEIILRETAILGILGVRTLGFYVDSAISELRLDRAVFLIVLTALLTMSIDALSRAVRRRLRLTERPEGCSR